MFEKDGVSTMQAVAVVAIGNMCLVSSNDGNSVEVGTENSLIPKMTKVQIWVEWIICESTHLLGIKLSLRPLDFIEDIIFFISVDRSLRNRLSNKVKRNSFYLLTFIHLHILSLLGSTYSVLKVN